MGVLACDDSPDDSPDDAALFGESLDTWTQLRDEHGNSYRYARSEAYGEVVGEDECIFTTTIDVIDGVVTRRELTGEPLEFGSCPDPFVEEGAELGSHSGSGIAELLTLDELYALCEAEVIGTAYPFDDGNPEQLEPFEVDAQGLMSRCGWHYWSSTHIRIEASPYIDIDMIAWLP